MTEKEAIKRIMKERGWSQARLAREAGFKNQSNVGMMLSPSRQSSMNTDNLVSLAEALGCELVIRDKLGSEMEWVIDMVPLPDYSDIPKNIIERLEGKSEEERNEVLSILGYR